jgi:CDP-glucose 4,6-dehydratase
VNADFWHGKRVLLTGHTGFKGGWLSLWLQKLGASVTGYALPPADESLFELARVGEGMESVYADILRLESLQDVVERFRPEIVFHLAAQPLVRESYAAPAETFRVNVLGTVHVFEAVRASSTCRVVVNVTSDKCYENREWLWAYREEDALGGHDPYSSSKACAELITAAYRRSFFEARSSRPVAVASARAGNVIGGGDFARDRLVPDLMAAARQKRPLRIRNPDAVRPWQHVLEPLSGYLLLAEKLWENPSRYSQSWNFGPPAEGTRPVRWIVAKLGDSWSESVSWELDGQPSPHEAQMLTLDSTKARTQLGWMPQWTLEQALEAVVQWFQAYERHLPLRDVVLEQIQAYESLAQARAHT